MLWGFAGRDIVSVPCSRPSRAYVSEKCWGAMVISVLWKAEVRRITLRMRLPPVNRANARLGEPPPEPAASLQLKLPDTFKLTNTARMVINPTYLAQRTRSCMDSIKTPHWEE
jgi:hypothetical protein